MNKFVGNISLLKPKMVAGCICDNVIFAISLNCNGLFEINMETGVVELVNTFPGETYGQNYISVSCIKVGQKIIFAPYFGAGIYFFDILDRSIKKIETDFKIAGISRMFEWHKNIFMISETGGYIICFDPYHEKVIQKIDIYSLVKERLQTPYLQFADCEIYEYKDCIYCPLWDYPVILKMELLTGEITFIKIKEFTSGIVQMIGRNNELIILGKENKLAFQNLDNLETIDIFDLPANIKVINYRSSFFVNDSITFWSDVSDEMLEVNGEKICIESKKIKINDQLNDDFAMVRCNDRVLILLSDNGRLFVLYLRDGRGKMIQLNYKIQDEFYKHIINEPIMERKNDLKKYFKFISTNY